MIPHIGIEARLISERKGGIGQYTFQLYRRLEKSDSIRVTLFDDDYFQASKDFTSFQSQGFRKIAHIIWLNTKFPRIMQKAGVDLLHSPNFLPPFYSEIPSVVTFHDLGFLRYPHTHHWLYARIYPAFAKKAVVKASRIIVPSKSTYDEIAYYYPQVKNKLRIIPEGADDCFKKITDNVVLDEVRLKYHLPDKFLLIVGTLEPRKNLERFFQAFKLYVSRNPNSDFRLFLCGKSWLRHKQFMQNLKNSSIQDKVTITGYVPNEDLVGVYNCAYALAFPSYYEGFGIPAVEAMRCGVPVLASNAFSLPEVLGDAGLYFNPFDIEEMASAIAKIANNSELRNELAERGWKRSEIFSWEKSAKMTEEVYLEILK